MNILIACEESQAVTKAFREKGHNAFSCDIVPCSGGHPEWHIQGDALKVIRSRKWDRVISFPPCTDLAVSGARWFAKKRVSGEQEKSIKFFFEIWKLSDCVENPVGIMGGGEYIKKWFPELWMKMDMAGFPFKASQIIQPWEYGHGETKATCLFLKDWMPLLEPTKIVSGREQRIWKMAPGPERAKERSKTFPGIASAMASFWG